MYFWCQISFEMLHIAVLESPFLLNSIPHFQIYHNLSTGKHLSCFQFEAITNTTTNKYKYPIYYIPPIYISPHVYTHTYTHILGVELLYQKLHICSIMRFLQKFFQIGKFIICESSGFSISSSTFGTVKLF